MTNGEILRIHKDEFLKIIADPVLFVEKLMKIDGQPAKLYDYQKEFLRDKSENRVIEKARQLGMSVAMAYEAVYYSFIQERITNLFVSVTQNQSVELLRHSKEGWDSIPDTIIIYDDDGNSQDLVKGESRQSQLQMEFPNGSRIISLPNNPDAARGYRGHRVYWDEAAAFENEYEMLRAIGMTRVRGGYLTYNSTHHGTLTEFYKICEGARDKASKDYNGFSLHTVTWDKCPEEKYRKEVLGPLARQLGGVDSVGFLEEFCCRAVDESVSFISMAMLNACIAAFQATVDPITQKQLVLWNAMAYTGKSIVYIGIDIGRCVDSTVIIAVEMIGDLAVVRFIKEISNKSLPQQTKEIIAMLKATYFTRCWVDPKGLGMQLAETLVEEFGSKVELAEMQGPAKERMFTDLYSLIGNVRVLLPPKDSCIEAERLYNQLHALKREYTEKTHMPKYVGSEGTHDDYVFALAMALMDVSTPQIPAGISAIGPDQTDYLMQTRTGMEQGKLTVPEDPNKENKEWVRAFVSRPYDEPLAREKPCTNPECVKKSKGMVKPIMMKLVQNSQAHAKGSEWLCEVCGQQFFHVEVD
jgi:phage FluMu gp28-like protein